ncbi:MAG: MATE family efflux transporter [Rhodobacterales bacterium]|nr:MATE family efflux transporter [Rhodobacterales bacterium]
MGAVWSVSWPMVCIGLLRTGYLLTDTWFVGRLGDDALTATGCAAFAWWILLLLGDIGGTGVHAIAAQRVGAGKTSDIGGVLTQGLWVALGTAFLALLLVPLVPDYFWLLGFDRGSRIAELGGAYLTASVLGAGAFALNAVFGGVFRGIGDTRTTMWVTVVTVVINGLLDPLLIWSAGLGIAGAAWATVIVNVLGAILLGGLLARRGLGPVIQGPDRRGIQRIVEVGAPVSGRGIAFSGIYIVLGRMITSFGDVQMAALGVGHRIESIPYLASVGFEVGTSTMVGQHIGAGDLKRARESARAALKLCLAFMVPISIMLFVFAEPLFDVFANEPETIAAGAHYLRIQSVVFVFMALESIYQGAFTGRGHTVPAFWIGALGTAARIPLAALLAWPCGMGITGIWLAIAISTAAKGVAMAGWSERSSLSGVVK